MRLQVIACVAVPVMSILLQQPASAQLPSSTGRMMGRIHGTVIDPNGAVIPHAGVIVESRQIKRELVTNKEGAYEVELPSGIYQISTNIPAYYPFRRATFCVQPGVVTTINMAPVLRVLAIGLEVTSSGSREPITTAPPPKYESFSPPQSSGPRLDLLVRFSKRRKRGSNIEYAGAVASYNALTIYADKMRLEPKTSNLKAEGNVVVEDGKQRLQTNRAELEFKAGGQPILKLAQ